MADLVALGVQSPQINAVQNFQASQSNSIAQAGALEQQHQAALEHLASLSLGVLGGDPNGVPDPQRLATMKALMAPAARSNPETAKFLKLLDTDPKGTLQGAVTMSMQALQFGMAQKTFARQSALDQSTINKNNAEASMYGNGGPAAGGPFQDANGIWYQATENGTIRPLTTPGGTTGATLDATSPASLPTQTGPSDTGLAPSVAGNAPVPTPSPAAPAFMSPVEMEGKKGYAGQRGGDLAKTMDELQTSARKAVPAIGQLDALAEAFKTTPQGWGADTLQNVRKAASALGVDSGNLGTGDLVNSISNQLALILRNPASGGGMPGSLSDSDRNFLSSMVPGLTNTPNGNKYIAEAARLVFQRQIDVAKLASDYAKKHGGQIDDNFMGELQDFSNSHPIFDDLTKQIQSDTPSASSKVVDMGNGITIEEMP